MSNEDHLRKTLPLSQLEVSLWKKGKWQAIWKADRVTPPDPWNTDDIALLFDDIVETRNQTLADDNGWEVRLGTSEWQDGQ